MYIIISHFKVFRHSLKLKRNRKKSELIKYKEQAQVTGGTRYSCNKRILMRRFQTNENMELFRYKQRDLFCT